MKRVYDFSKGKRGAVIPTTGKTRITIYIDDATLKRFKTESEKSGKGYQTLINDALRDRKSTRLNSSHGYISYAVFCLKKKKNTTHLSRDHHPCNSPVHNSTT